jgi:hypothetical protein
MFSCRSGLSALIIFVICLFDLFLFVVGVYELFHYFDKSLLPITLFRLLLVPMVIVCLSYGNCPIKWLSQWITTPIFVIDLHGAILTAFQIIYCLHTRNYMSVAEISLMLIAWLLGIVEFILPNDKKTCLSISIYEQYNYQHTQYENV